MALTSDGKLYGWGWNKVCVQFLNLLPKFYPGFIYRLYILRSATCEENLLVFIVLKIFNSSQSTNLWVLV